MTECEFKSQLKLYMVGLVAQKRALGCKYTEQVKLLKKFDEFCLEQFPNEHTVTKPMLEIWSVLRPTECPGTLRNRVTVISHLAQYICALGCEAYVFPTNDLPKEPKYTPHIYTNDELQRLFRQIDCCEYTPLVPNRHLIMPLLFRMLYCCGLRLGEALRLGVSDVDLSTGELLIRDTKYDNDRFVPMSAELAEMCRVYAKQVHVVGTQHQYFFPSHRGGQISSMNIYTNFRRFLQQAGISHGGKGIGPRIYDFRHTFAVNCLKRMVLDEKDLAVYHQVLKTYMGHSFFKYTAYYLRLTKDMFPDIRQKMETFYEAVPSSAGGERDA